MEYTKLGNTDIEVSRLCMGCMSFGDSASQMLAWQLAKGVASPIIGVTKEKYLDDAVQIFDVKLSKEDIDYLEEMYVPHKIVGAL